MMNAHKFVADYGIERAKNIIAEIPDKTATHWEFRKIPNYYSVDFQTWFHDGEWWDSDCHTEQDLIDSYGDDFVVNLSELKQVIESVNKINDFGGIGLANLIDQSTYDENLDLDRAIADYKLVQAYKNGEA